MKDSFKLGNKEFNSRFILGSGKYSNELINSAINYAEAEIVTVAMRRAVSGVQENILDYIPKNITLLPNTSGARNAEEAVKIARLARECTQGDFIKIEVIKDSFIVMPYMYPDLNVARALRDAGASCIMPLAAPIGSNRGLITKEFIQILIDEIDLPIIVDAGIGKPSQACEAMEMGVTAIMANTAIATTNDIPRMARAFKYAIQAGREAYLAKLGRVLEKGASASSPLTGFLNEVD